MPNLLKPYVDFRGGLNTDAAPDNVQDNELVQADNVDLSERGGLSKRKGTVRLNASSYGGQVEQLFEWARDDGSQVLMAVIGTTLCQIAENGERTNIQTLAGERVGYYSFQDRLYFLDGNEYRVYDGSAVAQVTAKDDPECDLAPIRRCRLAVRHPKSFRFFAAGDPENPSAVFYSEPNEPGFFKATSKVVPTSGDGPVTGLVVFVDAVLVFYRNSVWMWRGIDPAQDAVWERLPTGQGTVSGSTIALTQNSLTFLGRGGLYAIPPSILSYAVTIQAGEDLVPNLAKFKVTGLLKGIVYPEKARGVYDPYNERYLLAYCDDPNILRNNRILVYDWSLQAFTRYTGVWANDLCYRANGDLLVATDGYILKMGEGYRDGPEQAIEMTVKTKAFNLEYPFHKKRMLRLYTCFRQADIDVCRIDARILVDDVALFDVQDATVYDSFVWGDPWGEPWGWRSLITTRAKISGSGHRVQVQFSNRQLDMPTTIYGLAIEFRPIRAKGARL